MEFLELVKRRQSVRKYLDKPVPRKVSDRCLEAARLAPSACNSQPWTFIIVDNKELKNKLANKAFSGIYSVNSFAKKAPVLVVVITERASYAVTLGGYFKGTQYNLIDIGIACEHFALQATEEDLCTCIIGWFNGKGVKKVLGVPKNKKIDIMISLGYPQDNKIRNKVRKSLDEIREFY